ncbi:MAG TPA: DUF1156 domain-containing protein [Chloroflexota bacterium]|nr:DUF1156 domain-containing protein [Chloroflexota bacterium]
MDNRKKLIEVALPLEAINKAAASEKGVRGHPNTLHQWWARRPLAACRAVIFASLVDDPGGYLPESEAEKERTRLFAIMERLVDWSGATNDHVLDQAKLEIARSAARASGLPEPQSRADVKRLLIEVAPPVYDPFSGSGSIPLEAQRLGLRSLATDLNPVPVIMTRAVIDYPVRFGNRPPVNPGGADSLARGGDWRGAAGLAADIRYYARWARDEAQRRIGDHYPKGPRGETVLAWIWARTVTCPNPACRAQMPLVRAFWLSSKPSRKAWLEPIVDHAARTVRFEVRTGQGGPREGTVNRRGASCLVCGPDHPVKLEYVRAEGRAGRLSHQLLAAVVDAGRGRGYLSPTPEQEAAAQATRPLNPPDIDLPAQALGFRVQNYGMRRFSDLYTDRQLLALTTLADLVKEARAQILADTTQQPAAHSGRAPDDAEQYAKVVSVYLALALSKAAGNWSSLTRWLPASEGIAGTFGRPTLSMVWDFVEANVLSHSLASWLRIADSVADSITAAPADGVPGRVEQRDAATSGGWEVPVVVSTDPPYYDNIGYAHLSDYYYIWLRRMLADVEPDLFHTIETPKTQELVAEPARFQGSRNRAASFFKEGFHHVFERIRAYADPHHPMTVYYAFKQAERDDGEGGELFSASTGWETALSGLVTAGFELVGTWPMHTEMAGRLRDIGSNALASSIILVCRPRPASAASATRRELLAALRSELPAALRELQHGNIAPVDLAQAAIGPGMSVYTRYTQVLDAEGKPLSVREALTLINQTLDEVLAEQEGDFDADTRWALAWYDQFGFADGDYGVAETLSTAKNTSVSGMAEAGILASRSGKVRLLRPAELPADWDPATDRRLTVWETVHHLVRALESGGEGAAAELIAKLGSRAETARELAYRLFNSSEQRQRATEARSYNALVQSWPEITRLARELGTTPAAQPGLFAGA